MGLLDGIEKLITEHGSSSILKERIALANDKYAALEEKLSASELRANNLESENEALKLGKSQLQEQVRTLKNQLSHNTNPHGYVCDYCGSSRLKRTGSRASPSFGVLGIKDALFICESCGQESAFTEKP